MIKKKRLLTLQDLYNYYSSTNISTHFSSNDKDENLVVQVSGKIKFDKSEKHTEGLTPVTLQACHTEKNLNKSSISEKVMKSALPSFSNRPILGYIRDVDGQPCFEGHNMHIDEENDELVYDEIAVGIIPESCNAHLEYDEDKDHNYVIVNGYIFNEYTKAAEILEREQELSVSVELSVRELSYSAEEKVLNIDDFYFSGVTILQCDDNGKEVKPGMEGSNIKLTDFSAEENSAFNQYDEIMKKLDSINDAIANFNTNENQGKEVIQMNGNKDNKELETIIEEEQFEKTASEETLDNQFEESSEEEIVEESFEDAVKEETIEESFDDETTKTGEEQSEEFEEENSEEGTEETYSADFTVAIGDTSKTFAVSLSDIIYSLTNLVNETYGDDYTYYGVEVYADEKYVIMKDWWTGDAYKQSYKVKKDVYTLTGDRVPVKAVYLTADEEKALDDMRANYSSISERLQAYEVAELNAQKEAILGKEEYSKYLESDEFKAVKEAMESYSLEDLEKECDLAFAKCVKKLGFSMENEEINVKAKRINKLSIPVGEKFASAKKDVYGGIFNDVNTK